MEGLVDLPGTGVVVETLKDPLASPPDLLQQQSDQDDAQGEVVGKTDDDPEEVDQFHGGGRSEVVERLLKEIFTCLLAVLGEGVIDVLVENVHDGVNCRSHPQELTLVQLRGWVEGLLVDERENIEDKVCLLQLLGEETDVQHFLFIRGSVFLAENRSQTLNQD